MSDYLKKRLNELQQISNKSYLDQRLDELKSIKQTQEASKAAAKTKRISDDDIAPVKNDTPWHKSGHFEDGWQFGDVTKSILGIETKKEKEEKSLIKSYTSQADIAREFGHQITAPTLEELATKRDTSKTQADKLKYTQKYNNEYLAQTSKLLSQTKMDGTNRTILEEMEAIAKMDSGKDKRQRKKAVLEKMEAMGIDTSDYALFIEDKNFNLKTFGQWLDSAAVSGLTNFSSSLANTAEAILGDPLQKLGWENNPVSKLDDYFTAAHETNKYNTELLKQKLGGGGGMQFAGEAVEGTVAALPNVILAIMTAGKSLEGTTAGLMKQAAYQGANILQKAGMTATNMIKDSQFWLSFARSYGSDYDEAKSKGVSDTVAAFGATINSLLNAGLEIGFDGASGIQGLTKDLKDGDMGKVLPWIESALEEGGEEGLQKFVSEIVGKAIYRDDSEILNPIEYGREIALGTMSGLALGGGQIAVESGVNAYNQIQANKLTDIEQKVYDKVVADEISKAKENGEVTKKDKAKIRNDVRTYLEKGYISTDTIEEVLGADAKNLVKNSRLAESYRENERVYEDLDIDPDTFKDSKHADAARQTIESALALKANNTNRVRDLVENSARIAAETGKAIVFKDNETVKNSFIERQTRAIAKLEAKENKTENEIKLLEQMKQKLSDVQSGKIIVNGDYSKNGIVVNIDSKKPIMQTVGHEITHNTETAKSYDKMREALFAYANTKGIDVQTRIDMTKLEYEGIEDAVAEREVVADLVGEMLFTDDAFVEHLAKTNTNVFQSLWNDIKHLISVVTPGSKDAKELEALQYRFEKAYREANKEQKNTTKDGGANYSLKVEYADGTIDELADLRSLTDDQVLGYLEDVKSFDLIDETYIPIRRDLPQVIIDSLAEKGIIVENRSLVMEAFKARKLMKSNLGNGRKGHGLKPQQILDIINDIENPVKIIYQTNRVDENGEPIEDNVAIFVRYSRNGVNGFATVEFTNPERTEVIGEEFGDTSFYTANTAFFPDTIRNGKPYNYMEVLENNPNNFVIEIKRRQAEDSANWTKHPSTTDELPSNTKVAQKEPTVNEQNEKVETITEERNEHGLDAKAETEYSLSRNTEFMDKAIEANKTNFHVSSDAMAEAKGVRDRVANRMNEIKDRGLVGLPEDIEGNTYIANSSYDGTEENTTICPRSLASEAFVDAVSEYLGRPLSVEEQIYISQDLQGRSLTPECTYCYVATDRKAYRAFLGDYITQRDAVLDKVKADPNADVSRKGDLYKEFLNGRKDTNPMYNRFKMWVDAYKNGKPMVEASHLANISKLMGDINSEFGAELKPQIVDAMKYAQSASWAKKRVNYVAYNGHILKWKQDRINKLNNHYGLRMYSFSDFHPAFVLENMQMITDASVRGLKMLGYTKDTDFVEIFAPSGMNINVSTFGFETGGNVYENNIIGAQWDKAKALRDQYPNVGITFVATNDTIVEWALKQDWIDVVIPYHLVRTGAEVAKAFGYTNYTSESSDTKDTDWTKGKDKKYIAPTEHNNDKATYMAALEKNHLKPRFERFIDDPNYMKLVNESRQPASKSKPVQPVFNEDAAMVALAKLEANGYYQPIGGSVDKMYEIASEVAEDMKKQLAPTTQYSLSRSDAEYEADDRFVTGENFRVRQNAEDIAPVQETVAEGIAPVANNVSVNSEKASEAPAEKTDAQTEEDRVASILTDEPVVKKKNGVMGWVRNNLLDKGMVFEKLSKRTKNRELEAKWNSIRYSNSKAQHLIGEGTNGVKALNTIREQVEKTGKTQAFYEYLYHRHNVDRMSLEDKYQDMKNKPVFGSSVTADDSRARARMLEMENPKFKDFAQDVYNYMNHLRKEMVDNGVISQELADKWAEMYPNYVPIRRAGDFGLSINVPLDSRRTGVNVPVKKATGGNRDILPLFDTMGQRTMQTYKAIAKNRFGIELKNTLGTPAEEFLDENGIIPNGTIVRAADRSNFGTVASYDQTTGKYSVYFKNDKGQTATVALDAKLLTPVRKNTAKVDEVIDAVDQEDSLLQAGKRGKNPTFTVFENGEKVTFEITDEMYDAMKPTSDILSYTNKVTNTVSSIFRGLTTEFNPAFMLTNPIKDLQDVLLNSQHPGKTYSAIPEAIKQLASHGTWYQEYVANGGEQNSYFDSSSNTFVKEKQIPVLSQISKANNFIEMTPRLAEYIASRKDGRSIDVSMLDASRVTTNFAAGGDVTKFLNRNGATFLNASVQGAIQNVRNIQEAKMNGLKGVMGLAAKFAVAGLPMLLLNNLVWEDDEEYEELSEYVKQNYYVVGKFNDGQFVRIPKGRAVAVIQEAFNQMENLITGDDEADMKSFLDLMVSNLAPNNPLDNNIIAPILQVKNNRTWYGEDLVPTRLQDVPAAEQYDESTDSVSRWLGEKLNVSPYKINYLINQYTGAVGDMVLPMITPKAESGDNSLAGNLLAPLKDKFTTDSVMNNQNVTDFYDTKDELAVSANASTATDDDILSYKYMTSIGTEVSELYKQKRQVQNSDLADDAKYEKVRNIQKQINELMEEGLSNYQNITYVDENHANVGSRYYEWYTPENDDPYWKKMSDDQVTKYLITKDVTDSDYATNGEVYYKRDKKGEWNKMTDDQVMKYRITTAAGDAYYATNGNLHYRRDENGEWTKISDKELARQREVTRSLGITANEYWKNTDTYYIPMRSGEYEYAYDNPESYAMAKAVGGYDAYQQYSSELGEIKADKDKYGKSISGSRKKKIQEYIKNMDADPMTKIILYKSQYTSFDDYNYEICEYLNGRDDISRDEMLNVLRKLDFKVDAEGNIYW